MSAIGAEMRVAPCSEFPNDNPVLHRGRSWLCREPLEPATCDRDEPSAARVCPPPSGTEDDEGLEVEIEVVESLEFERVEDEAFVIAPVVAAVVEPGPPFVRSEDDMAVDEASDGDEASDALDARDANDDALCAREASDDALDARDANDDALDARDASDDALDAREASGALDAREANDGTLDGDEAVATDDPSAADEATATSEGAPLAEDPAEAEDAPADPEPDPFGVFVSIVTAVAAAAGGTAAQSGVLRALLGAERMEDRAVDERSAEALVGAGMATRTARGFARAAGFGAQVVAWQSVLRGESDDLSACGSASLDEWAASLVACALGDPSRAVGVRRQLRDRGVAAFGLVARAA